MRSDPGLGTGPGADPIADPTARRHARPASMDPADMLYHLFFALGIEPGLPFEEQLEAAADLASDARQLHRAYDERDEALRKVRELDDALAQAQAEPQPVMLYRCEGCGQITGSHHAERCCRLCGPVARVAA